VGNTTTAGLTPVLAGTGTVNGAVTILGPGSGSAGHLAPGTGGSTGTLTVGSLTLNAGSQLDWNITSPSTLTQVSVTTAGGLTISGGQLNINGGTAAFTTAGVYNLIGYSGSLGGATANLSLNAANQSGGYTYTFGSTGSFITLTVAAPAGPVSSAWASSTGGSYETSGNWTAGVPTGQGATATFGSNLSTSGTVSLASGKTVGQAVFSNGSASYTVGANGGSALTIDNTGGTGTAGVQVTAGSHTIAAPVVVTAAGATMNVAGGSTLTSSGGISDSGAGATLTSNGAGTLNLSGTQSYSALSTTSGTTNLNTVLGSGSSTITATGGATNINPGNAGVQKLSALSVGAGAVATLTAHTGGAANVKAIDTSSLALSGSGALNLTNNALVVRGGNLAAIAAEIVSGRTGNWTGAGLNSSTAAADTQHITGLGVATAAAEGKTGGTFAGVSGLSAGDVLVKYTYLGDANFDGTVNAADYAAIDNGFAFGLSGWANGDFNLDGVINAADYAAIDNAFAFQGGVVLAGGGGAAQANSIQAVPEPTTNALLLFGAAAVIALQLKRKRFKNQKASGTVGAIPGQNEKPDHYFHAFAKIS
jgi:hypothetical protein